MARLSTLNGWEINGSISSAIVRGRDPPVLKGIPAGCSRQRGPHSPISWVSYFPDDLLPCLQFRISFLGGSEVIYTGASVFTVSNIVSGRMGSEVIYTGASVFTVSNIVSGRFRSYIYRSFRVYSFEYRFWEVQKLYIPELPCLQFRISFLGGSEVIYTGASVFTVSNIVSGRFRSYIYRSLKKQYQRLLHKNFTSIQIALES